MKATKTTKKATKVKSKATKQKKTSINLEEASKKAALLTNKVLSLLQDYHDEFGDAASDATALQLIMVLFRTFGESGKNAVILALLNLR